MTIAIGKSIQRIEAWDKVTGKAQYTDDFPTSGLLDARLLTSTYAHAKINGIDLSKAMAIKGVKMILTGADCPELFGPLVQDRPALARDVVRYAGEPVAMVIAKDAHTAEQALRLIEVEYEPLAVVLNPTQALAEGAPLIHRQTNGYKKEQKDIYPESGTNIASRYRIRKGNLKEAFDRCNSIIEQRFFLPPSDHIAMEVRTARAEISTQGNVKIITSSQSPYSVQKQIAEAFLIPSGKIQVEVPFVGGGYGGKSPVSLEILAFLASRSVDGKPVRLTIPREQDMATAPCRIGMEAHIKIGTNKNGVIEGAELTYWLDSGAYTDIAPYMAKAVATDCTGPYQIENLSCDSICVYTNHTYATAYRSFAHESYTFCIERAMDMLAEKCKMDPLEFRLKNRIREGSKTPSQVEYSPSIVGDLNQCLLKVKKLANWDGGKPILIKENTVRAKGISCFWKTENPPMNAISGAIITFNSDGSVNLQTGVVEMGSGGQTHLAQMLAEKLKIDPDQVHVILSVDTRAAPEHWKTVASLTEYMAGHAVMRAAQDLINQLRQNASEALGCPSNEIEVSHGSVFSIKNPQQSIALKDIAQGYLSNQGKTIGEPAIGRGGFLLKDLSPLDPKTGQGKTGPAWTLGAQVVEVEADLKTYTYRILNATTVIDVGKVINPEAMRAMVAGGMAMGMSLASREAFIYDSNGIPKLPNLRTYKLMHIGQEPDYRVGFVETKDEEAPFGIRAFSEHGIIGIPAALSNALSSAFGKQFLTLPLHPENIWRSCTEKQL